MIRPRATPVGRIFSFTRGEPLEPVLSEAVLVLVLGSEITSFSSTSTSTSTSRIDAWPRIIEKIPVVEAEPGPPVERLA